MSPEGVVYIGRQALLAALMLSGPILGTSLIVGISVALLQSITSVREMTLTIIPKIVTMGIVLALAISWMIDVAIAFTLQMFAQMSAVGV